MDKFKSLLKSYGPYVLVIVVVVLIRTFLVTPIIVQGTSMEPTLKEGNVMILNKVAKIDRYDIVVIKSDKNSNVLIKRVIGMPGETIEIKDGHIFINDKLVNTKHSDELTSDYPLTIIGKDEYFVLGDNRSVSADSRVFGTFKKSEIKGTTKLRIFPLNKIKTVK